MKKALSILNHIVLKRPKITIFITAIFIALLSSGLSKFEVKNDVRIWFDPNDPKLDNLNYLEETFGNDETLVIAIHSKSGIFTPKNIKTISQLTEDAWYIPQVTRVDSITNFNHISAVDEDIIIDALIDEDQEMTQTYLDKQKALALSDPSVKGYLLDKDANFTLLFASLVPSNVQSPNYKNIVLTAREVIKKNQNDDLTYYITGKAGMVYAFEEVSYNDMSRIAPALFVLLIGYLFYVFRSFSAMVLPLLIVISSVATTLGFTFHMGIKFSAMLGILPIILVAIAIADSVHIMVNFFQFRGAGNNREDSIKLTLEKNLMPTFLTSFSTMVGLMSLSFTDLIPIGHLGMLAGMGCMLAWIYTIFLLTPTLALFDFKTPPIFFKKEQGETSASRFTEKSFDIISKFRVPIIIASLTTMGLAFYYGSQIKVNADPDSYFSQDSSFTKANNIIKKYIGGIAGPDLIFNSGKPDGVKDPAFLAKLDEFNSWLRSLEPVNNTVTILDTIKMMNQVINKDDPSFYKIPSNRDIVAEHLFLYSMSIPEGMDLNNRLSLDNEATRISILWTVYDTSRWQVYTKMLKDKANELGLEMKIAGKASVFQGMIDYIVATFLKSILMAIGIVAMMMMISFRSVTIGLFSLVPNILPLSYGALVMKIMDLDLNLGTSLVASVCLGIAVDDTIHFLSNFYKNRREGMSDRDNIIKIFRYTGSALMITTFILSSAFGLYVLGDFLPNKYFGILCSITLMVALIIDVTFLPALLLFFSKEKKS
jgi:predicted RND superfamily exporter protein